jgi:hypothetical protein
MRKLSFFFQWFIGVPVLQTALMLGGCDGRDTGLNSHSYFNIEQATAQYMENPNFIKDIVGVDALVNRTFCSYQVYGMEAKTRRIHQYLWVVCREYDVQENQLLEIRGGSFPVSLIFTKGSLGYQIINHRIPRQGKEGASDLPLIFPDFILNNSNFPLNNTAYSEYLVTRLGNDTKQAAKSYFKMD